MPDLNVMLTRQIEYVTQTYLKDLSFVPEDKLTVSPMGVARPPLEFTAECAGFNLYVASILSGSEPVRIDPEARKAYFASIDTKDKAVKALEESATTLLSAITEADLTKEVTAPWGETMTSFGLASMASYHMTYHDGQINYIQSLYGDAENHW